MAKTEKNTKRSKFNAKKVTIDGIRFDSIKESERYRVLKALLNNGEIINLQCHVNFDLIPKRTVYIESKEPYESGAYETIRKVSYIADFVYEDVKGKLHVEDVKGCRKGNAYQIFMLKKKLMLDKYNIYVEEI